MCLNIKNIKSTELSSIELVQISEIFKSSFKIKIKPKSLYKKYVSNTFGFSFHAIVKNSQNELIGIYTFSPRIFWVDHKKIKAIQSLDTCFPYSGLVNPFVIKKLVNDLIEYSKNNISDLSFIYGFPNKKYEKLSKYILNWDYVLTLYSRLDIFPLINFFYLLLFKNYNSKNFLKITPNQDEIETRIKSVFHSRLNISNKNEFTIWFTKNPFYLQIFNKSFAANDYLYKKGNFFNKINFISRLLIPSISSSTKKPFWRINQFFPKFNLYIVPIKEGFSIEKLYLDVNFLWNDVP